MPAQKTPSFIRNLLVLLFASAIFIFVVVISQQQHEPEVLAQVYSPETPVMLESRDNFFTYFPESYDSALYELSDRNLKGYYALRAYPGAPPVIPHPLLSEKGIGGLSCLQCHQNGGYVPQFKAFAPITPHPELLSCKQCHVPVKTASLFKETQWEKIQAPLLGQKALLSSPPVIPHGLEMRNNCLSCHAGPAAPAEIRVSHPERVNCRQCHVPASKVLPEEFFSPYNASTAKNDQP